jgi:hypothetical protein
MLAARRDTVGVAEWESRPAGSCASSSSIMMLLSE